ncbi:MAG: DUF4249 domain-containing protein [Flavobacteriales bacterium]|jgi:hypothetical protein|nr:DUF4249 domain-containing protein [Flavobacteriales bacterium]MBK6754902.1 DUF4249 domain-containing protein [Flavobacteriales bacterium]MBK7084011.1 DUF4249 domain-containing protein [Flavobacteriales bacterium]MBK7270293.1 DUF4249 domain-containing protein [Flavobacteriales bacterium]MBK7753158.1 DUF4249 domain-containing protein [Flavobacteriales bacterium]
MRYLLLLLTLVVIGCSKEITVDLPETETKLVVEATIEPGQPPFIILTRTQSYFAPADPASFANIFVRDAVITVQDGTTTYTIPMVCSSILTEQQLMAAALATGLDPDILANLDICLYTSLTEPATFGVVGRTYTLTIQAEGKTLTSTTTIPGPPSLDTLWFTLLDQEGDDGDDSTGFVWGRSQDPDTLGNCYRALTRRTNLDSNGDPVDPTFAAPLGSTSNDEFFNGQVLEYIIARGNSSFSDPADGGSTFKRGDTVLVKLYALGRDEFDFYRSFESNVATQGDLFSQPSNVKSNITGGLGVWAGLSPTVKQVICQP